MAHERPTQYGGITNTNSNVHVEGDMVGGDKIVTPAQARDFLKPVADAIAAAAPEARAQAEPKLAALEDEVAKGAHRNDEVLGTLVEGIVGLVPTAVSAVVAAFGGPVLSGLAGPVTSFVLKRLQGS